MKLITLQQACDYLRLELDAVNDLDLMIDGASGAVLNYLGSGADSFLDSNGDVILDVNDEPENIPAAVKQATLYLTAWFYRNRDADTEKAFSAGYLPAPVTAMLYPLRDPALS